MASPHELPHFDDRIKSMFATTWDAYQAHLESPESTPYPVERPIGMDLTNGGCSLFFTTMSFLARNTGIANRINFKIPDNPRRAKYWGKIAVVSYSTAIERVKEDAFLCNWGPKNSPARELMLNISQANQLLSIVALRAGVPIRDILEVFPHIDDDEHKRSETTYAHMKEVFHTNPDMLCSLIVHQNLRKYYNERFGSGLLLHEAHINLLKANQHLDPAKNFTQEIDRLTTDNMSGTNQGFMEKQALEALIRDGYEPIEPQVYVKWVRQIIGQD